MTRKGFAEGYLRVETTASRRPEGAADEGGEAADGISRGDEMFAYLQVPVSGTAQGLSGDARS